MKPWYEEILEVVRRYMGQTGEEEGKDTDEPPKLADLPPVDEPDDTGLDTATYATPVTYDDLGGYVGHDVVYTPGKSADYYRTTGAVGGMPADLETRPVTYLTVNKGDTLRSIAEGQLLHSGKGAQNRTHAANVEADAFVQRIRQLNPGIEDTGLQPGMQLRMPPVGVPPDKVARGQDHQNIMVDLEEPHNPAHDTGKQRIHRLATTILSAGNSPLNEQVSGLADDLANVYNAPGKAQHLKHVIEGLELWKNARVRGVNDSKAFRVFLTQAKNAANTGNWEGVERALPMLRKELSAGTIQEGTR